MDAMKRMTDDFEWMTRHSHFELVEGDELPFVNVIQIWPDKVYQKKNGTPVFLCEVIESEEMKDD